MRHTKGGRCPPIQQPHQIARVGITRNDSWTKFGALHHALIRAEIEPTLLVALAAGLVTVDAPPFEDRENILLEARWRLGGAYRIRAPGKRNHAAKNGGEGQRRAKRKEIFGS